MGKKKDLGSPQEIAEAAIRSVGFGYDICNDLRLKFRKGDSSLIDLGSETQDVLLPGRVSMADVPKSIKADKGERMRFTSDVLSFQQMAEQFNQSVSLSGKVPSGFFNRAFEFSGSWQKDAGSTKSLAFDGWFIMLYTIALSKSNISLHNHVKDAVPSSWNPAVLARFIERFGTHIIVGVKMGGKDVIYMRQQHSSSLQPAEIQMMLKKTADERFLSLNGHFEELHERDKFDIRQHRLRFSDVHFSSSTTNKEDIITLFQRRGGSSESSLPHSEWLETIQFQPDVISMSFVPITSLLNGVPGSGFLSHAINLYLRYKPRLEDLRQFLEFQLPRQWAPVFSDLPLGPQRKPQSIATLQFMLFGPKLYVNTTLVDVGKRPVTGLRLHLEGRRGNRLAIHLQHLSSLPQILQLEDHPTLSNGFHPENDNRKYYVPVQWRHFSHVCTAPIESEDDCCIVTGAQLHVEYRGYKKVLFLQLCFSRVQNLVLVKSDWDGSPRLTQKFGLISTLLSANFSAAFQKPPPQNEEVILNSAVYPGGPPKPVQSPRLLRIIDSSEMVRGPQDSPGYWMVSGAKLHMERGKISLRVKYSLLVPAGGSDNEGEPY